VPLVFVPRDVAHVSLPCVGVAFVAHGSCVVFGVNGHRSPMPVCRMMLASAKLSAAVVIQSSGVALVQCTLSAYAARARFSARAARVVRARVTARPGPGRSSAAGHRQTRERRTLKPRNRQPPIPQPAHRRIPPAQSVRQAADQLPQRTNKRPRVAGRTKFMNRASGPGLPPARTRSPPARRAGHRSARSKASWSIAECAPSFHGQMLACVNAEARTEPAAA
jgi:hypothetical protein